jgi:tetratricopeptide (TPR) repeat protein
MPLKLLTASCAIGALLVGFAAAEAVKPVPLRTVVPLSGAAAPSEKVDESALRYYARNNELDRVEAEIRRLQTLHPGWSPPANLFTGGGEDNDEQPFWDIFATDDLDELDRAIAARQSDEPAWRPSADLAAKIVYKRARQRLVNASDLEQWGKVLEIAATDGFVMSCADVDAMWRVAEARGRAAEPEEALAVYRRILVECENPEERLGTVRKALNVLPPASVVPLLALGKTDAAGAGEFDSVRPDIFRARLGAIAGGDKTETVDASELASFETAAEHDAANVDDAGLLGWYYYGQERWPTALIWFQRALVRGGDVKVAEGAVLALNKLERTAEAEKLASQWADRSTLARSLFLGLGAARLTADPPPELEESYVELFAVKVDAAQSGDGAQALGWYHYNKQKFEPAKGWFEKAMLWDPRDSTALGLVLSVQRLGDKKALAEFIASLGSDYPSVKALGEQIAEAERRVRSGGDSAAIALRDGDYETCLAILARQLTLSPPRSLTKGWCLMGANRQREAVSAFDAALSGTGKTRDDAAYGKSLALLRSGLSGEAVAAASAGSLSSERRNEIGTAVLGQQASDLFRQNRYQEVLAVLDRRAAFAAEPRRLGVLRGWSLYHLSRLADAKRQFTTLDQQLSTRESRSGLGAVTTRMLPVGQQP